MRTCEYRNCRSPISGRADKRYHSSGCRMAENRARERDERQQASIAALRLAARVDDGSGEEAYEQAETVVLARVKRKQSRGDYEAEWEWAKFRVAEVGDITKPFDEQDERVQRDARRVP